MKIAVVDPSAGASGDMFLGALLACGLDPNWIQGLPTRLGFGEVGVRISDVARCSVASKKIDFEFPGGQPEGDRHHGDHAHGHHVGDLIARIRGANLTDWVKDTAVAAFELLGEAEGQVHGVAPHDVHLHEVGAIDAVLEIVGVVEGFEQFGVDRIYNMPAAIGNGWVKATHGMLPVPAPATALLLEGVDIVSGGPVFGEATTPTGAVLLRVLSSGAPPPRWRPVKSGWGAGTRDPESYPNALRLIVAETVAEAETVEVLATDVDDMRPEYLEPLRDAVMNAGAVECVVWPTHGKKGRVSFRIEAYAAPEDADHVARELFRHSTTAGVRRSVVRRETLERRTLDVRLGPDINVRVKVLDPDGNRRLKAEYDDVLVAAGALHEPAHEVARRAELMAELELKERGS